AARKPPLAKFFTISGTVDEVVDGRITNIALQLQNGAAQQNREAFLILEIHRGGSKFGSVRDLAKFLTSARINRVRTVAWIPESVDGNNVILALACNEIVMHPEAELGDIGLGKAVDPDERFSVLSLVENRHNKKVSPGLAAGMMDPQAQVLKVTVQQGANAEVRVVTQDEYDRLQQAKVPILDVQTLKDAGQIGTFSGSKARAHDILVVQT